MESMVVKTDINSIQFRNIEEMLDTQNAEDRGRYFLCDCPECKEHEAFIYKNNPKMIICNRENECGEKYYVEYKSKSVVNDLKRKHFKVNYPELTNEQQEALDWSNRVLEYFREYEPSDTLDGGYRGLSKDLVRKHVVDLKYKEVVNMFFHKTQSLFKKDYRDNDFMMERNIIMPIYGDDGVIERVLLRSSLNPNAEPKELQLVLNPSKETRDFFIDVPDNAETIVITEALFDGLCFREIDEGVGFVALTGSRKTRKVKEYIQKNKQIFKKRKVILAMDDDVAGWKANQDIMESLEKESIDYQLFLSSCDKKDPNEFLNKNRYSFKESYEQVKKSFKLKYRDLVDVNKNSNTVVICASKLDAVSFRTIESNIGLIALASNNKKTNDLFKYIIENEQNLKEKQVVLALPNDRYGHEMTRELINLLDALELKHQVFNYPSNEKYPYEYSKENSKAFKRNFYESISKFKKRSAHREQLVEMEV